MSVVTCARQMVSRCLMPLARRAAQAYIAGEHVDDAQQLGLQLESRGIGVTLGYWDAPGEAPRIVADEYLSGIAAVSHLEHAYLSIKVPSLDYSRELMSEIVHEAARHKVRLHFDALGPETADRSRALCDEFLDHGAELSYTLPGRWQRSVDDAHWAAERGIVVRVVKGQWPDSTDPQRDLRQGFLRVIDALAGRARHVAVASHDVPLVAQAVRCLRGENTSCELELLHGLPAGPSLDLSDRLELAVRVYVPYGKAYLPYALSRVRNNPRILWWLARDLFTTQRRYPNRSTPRRRERVTS
jgi:proline dehydrogenase